MNYDIIFLSPHLDDAALSAGGAIWEWVNAGKSVLNLTIVAGDAPTENLSNFAQKLHREWGFPAAEVFAARRQEELAVSKILGMSIIHWDWQDAVYRLDEKGNHLYPTWADVIAGIHPAETSLIHMLAQQLQTLPPCEQIVAPLTVGGHADHRLVRRAAELAFGAENLLYYEDTPYILKEGALEAVIGNGDGWQAEVVPLSEKGLAKKIAGIFAYTSQIDTLFYPPESMPATMTQFAQNRGGERFWLKIITDETTPA